MTDTENDYILATKYILEDLPATDQTAFLDHLTPDLGIPTDVDATDFLEILYHGSALEMLQLLFLSDTLVGKHIYDLACSLAEANSDPEDDTSGEDGLSATEGDST